VVLRRKAQADRARKEDEADALHGRLATVMNPASAAAEAYRSLCAHLLYTLMDKTPKVIMLTSPGPREGRTTTCANLGVALVQADKNTLILDCDLRKPAIHKIFGLRNLWGMTDAVVEKQSLQEVCQEPVPGLKVVCTGQLPPDPTEVLGTRRFAEFLYQASQEFDYVVIDSPPIELVSDPLILAKQGAGVLLVLDPQKTQKGAIRRSMRRLEGVEVLGTVVNNIKVQE